MAHEKPCVAYKEAFDPVDLTTVKIEAVVGGVTRSKKVPVFKSATGIEGLFHVIDKFVKAGERLVFNGRDYWDAFEDVLDSTAENKWTNLTQAVNNNQKTRARFDTYVERLVHQYAQGDNPRDVLIDYIKEDCKKPRKVDTGIHASRVETLCRLANRLRGTHTELTDAQIKKMVFESFPDTWQNDYRKSHRLLEDDTIAQVVGYMNLCKSIADEEEDKRGKKRKAERIRGGGTTPKNSTEKNKKTRIESHDVCPHHGGHSWYKCSLNPRGPNYGKNFGRGRGRGYGRGNDSGRSNQQYQSNGGPGRGNGGGRGFGGRFQGRGGGRNGGRGYNNNHNGQYGSQDQYYHHEGEQPGSQHGWTQPESYYNNGSQAREGWQSGRSSSREDSPHVSWR